MSKIIRRETSKARIDHRCSFCECPIKTGDTYERDTVTDSGELYVWKSHFECSKYATLMMIDHYLEEMSAGEFQDGVFEDYRERFCDDGKPVLEKVLMLLGGVG